LVFSFNADATLGNEGYLWLNAMIGFDLREGNIVHADQREFASQMKEASLWICAFKGLNVLSQQQYPVNRGGGDIHSRPMDRSELINDRGTIGIQTADRMEFLGQY
jgi:hypothetical protein